MRARKIRNRSLFTLESLEVRTAPSHVSALAHAVSHVQHIKPAVHVEKLRDIQTKESNQSVETKTGTDSSTDTKTGSGSSSTDTSLNDVQSKDSKGLS